MYISIEGCYWIVIMIEENTRKVPAAGENFQILVPRWCLLELRRVSYDKVRDSCYILWPKVFILRITERHFKVFFSYVKKSHDFKSFFGNAKFYILAEIFRFSWICFFFEKKPFIVQLLQKITFFYQEKGKFMQI